MNSRCAALRFSACLAALLAAAGCDPPGKPGPIPPASQDIVDFQTLYGENCAGCHGENGRNAPGRILNDPLYLTVIPRDTLLQIVSNGRPGTAMPAWSRAQGGPLTNKQVAALVDGIESNWAKPAQFLVVKVGSRMIDSSLRTKLESLREAMRGH